MKVMNEAGNRFATVEDLIKWAHDEGYPYSLDNLREKFWDYGNESGMI